MKRVALWLMTGVTVLLAGCSGLRIVDSEVNSYSTLVSMPSPAFATYRFERLPSQQPGGEPQARLESMATQALEKVGMRRDDASARYSVQLALRVQRFERGPWDDPFWPGWGMRGPDYVVTANGQVVFIPSFPRMSMNTPWYEREISIVMRDLSTNQVVYETRAAHDGRWSDTPAVLPAMLEAALRGFPTPPQGPRRVDVEIAR
ncbi:DUF4136 domain-containing protein [Variovorax sp. VNK109]|jgi:hypothetical protein|uniref:DUF4136 domain-containing protein n=1 Tax=Variovorax sp. VNK109 TaxID=3400919 RepID=UPI003C0F3AA5